MAYFQKYYLEFVDQHLTAPSIWRVDIYDSEGEVPTEPFKLEAASNPLVTETLDTDNDKATWIIGRQITVAYKYTGSVNEPLPDVFFDSVERRFKIEVRRNGEIDGTYFIKPDFSEYDDTAAEFTVSLKAIDGFGFSDGILFNVADENDRLVYDKITVYEALFTRAIALLVGEGLPLNLVSSIRPDALFADDAVLFESYVHTDIFYDFNKGPVSVREVIEAFCKVWYARVFMAKNQIWIVRVQDIIDSNVPVVQYVDNSTANEIAVDRQISVGNEVSSYDALPIDSVPRIRQIPAIKRAQFEVTYKSIGRLPNFDWRLWDGTNFTFWANNGVVGLGRSGAGTVDDPYNAYFPYNPSDPGSGHLLYVSSFPFVNVGERIEITLPWRVTNVNGFRMAVRIQGANPGAVAFLSSGGGWVDTAALSPIEFTRTGKKRNFSISIRSEPIPTNIGGFDLSQFDLRILIYSPTGLVSFDGFDPPALEIGPFRLGINSTGAASRVSRIVNNKEFSQALDQSDFKFNTTGIEYLSNTLFVNTIGGIVPIENWISSKPGVTPMDIETSMSQAHIDQYQRSVKSWEGSLYGNNIEFYHSITFTHIPDRVFMVISDKYDNISCTHDVILYELFAEDTADTTYTEYDIEDETD
jgi:hypothetical protein